MIDHPFGTHSVVAMCYVCDIEVCRLVDCNWPYSGYY